MDGAVPPIEKKPPVLVAKRTRAKGINGAQKQLLRCYLTSSDHTKWHAGGYTKDPKPRVQDPPPKNFNLFFNVMNEKSNEVLITAAGSVCAQLTFTLSLLVLVYFVLLQKLIKMITTYCFDDTSLRGNFVDQSVLLERMQTHWQTIRARIITYDSIAPAERKKQQVSLCLNTRRKGVSRPVKKHRICIFPSPRSFYPHVLTPFFLFRNARNGPPSF